MVSGLVGYVLFGMGLLPLEKVPVIAAALQVWLPYEALPVLVSFVFSGIGLFLVELVVRIIGDRQTR
jgi:hypothetical protein